MAPPQTKITVPDHPIDNAPEFEQIDKEAKQVGHTSSYREGLNDIA